MKRDILNTDRFGLEVARAARRLQAKRYEGPDEILASLRQALENGADVAGIVTDGPLGSGAAFRFHGLTDVTLAQAEVDPAIRVHARFVGWPKVAACIRDMIDEDRFVRAVS